MRVLSVVHQDDHGPGVFAETAADMGIELVIWRIGEARYPEGAFGAILTFGGSAYPDEQDGWVPDEVRVLQELISQGVPALGICLGGQLLARALGAAVGPIAAPEFGWHEIELLGDGRSDPLLQSLPDRFTAFEFHHYGFDLPEDAALLARTHLSPQAFRYRDRVWGFQFHPEVTAATVSAWTEDQLAADGELPRRTSAEIGRWNETGRAICRRFLEISLDIAANGSLEAPVSAGTITSPSKEEVRQ